MIVGNLENAALLVEQGIENQEKGEKYSFPSHWNWNKMLKGLFLLPLSFAYSFLHVSGWYRRHIGLCFAPYEGNFISSLDFYVIGNLISLVGFLYPYI